MNFTIKTKGISRALILNPAYFRDLLFFALEKKALMFLFSNEKDLFFVSHWIWDFLFIICSNFDEGRGNFRSMLCFFLFLFPSLPFSFMKEGRGHKISMGSILNLRKVRYLEIIFSIIPSSFLLGTE